MRDLHDTELGARYTQLCVEPSDINEHLSTFVQLTRSLHAQKIIELGVRAGVSTVAWLHGLEYTGGHLWSVDISPPPTLPAQHWTFVAGDDLDPNVLAQLPELVDVVFIDTTHFYQQTLNELAAYLPRVRPGGRIVLHDLELASPDEHTREPPFPVKKAVSQFCKAMGLCWTQWTNNNGLASIQVPE